MNTRIQGNIDTLDVLKEVLRLSAPDTCFRDGADAGGGAGGGCVYIPYEDTLLPEGVSLAPNRPYARLAAIHDLVAQALRKRGA